MFLYFSGRMPQLSRLSGISRCGRISVAAMMRGVAGYTGFMSEQHYFSSSPETEFKPRTVQVELAGREVSVTTANGIFSPSGREKGTAVLLGQAPAPHGKYMLDIGCGWGPIALSLAMLAPQAEVYAVDVNSRSVSPTHKHA